MPIGDPPPNFTIGGGAGGGGAGGDYNNTYTTVATTYTTVPRPANERCLSMGHVVGNDQELLRYIDGVTVGKCKTCDERIQVEHIPTGDLLPKAKWILAALMELDDGDAEGLLACMEELAELQSEEQRLALDLQDVCETVKLAHGIVSQKWPR